MIDKIIAKIKRYPFQTGIAVGCVICLLLVGFVSLFQDNGKTLANNIDIIREDYLRMTINQYGQNRDSQLANWRYEHLGHSADNTLRLMKSDESITPQLLVSFAESIGKADILGNNLTGIGQSTGTPASPRKGLSGFGVTVLVILGLVVLCAAGLYIASMIKTRKKQKLRAEHNQVIEDDLINIIAPESTQTTSDAPDTLFDLDQLFPQKTNEKQGLDINLGTKTKKVSNLSEILDDSAENGSVESNITDKDEDNDLIEIDTSVGETEENINNDSDKNTDNKEMLTESDNQSDEDELNDYSSNDVDDNIYSKEPDDIKTGSLDDREQSENKSGLDIETGIYKFEKRIDTGEEEPEPHEDASAQQNDDEIEFVSVSANVALEHDEDVLDDTAEKPLVETDIETDPNSEDELLKMIRGAKTDSETLIGKQLDSDPLENDSDNKNSETAIADEVQEENQPGNDILIHYQSVYRIGNDMYDEVFSIDQGETFRGECGIGIGETLNNTEPKAVTAFEIWLFDKDDIHTSTWYLMSDFALSNQGILERLQQHGNCERIKKNGIYILETETLEVEIRVIELEYGNEMEEKNSYFTNVTFDVIARSKPNEAGA